MATPWWQQTAVALAVAYRNAEVSPVQVLGDCWARIEAINPRLNALVALRRDAAFADAAASAERFTRGQPLGWLDVIPLAIKDNIPSADLATT